MTQRECTIRSGFLAIKIITALTCMTLLFAAKTVDIAASEVNPSTNNFTNTMSNLNNVSNMTRAEPEDIYNDTENGPGLVTEIIAGELSKSTPSEIANYPLDDLSSDDLLSVMNSLSTLDLIKVLNNVDIDILKVLDNPGNQKVSEILNKLPPPERQKVLNKFTATS